MSRYKAYPEYKESGVEWIGAIPKDWDMWKISHACPYVASGTTPKSDDDVYYGGDTLWVTTGELREGLIFDTQKKVTKKALDELPTLRVHPEGSVAIAMYGATIGRLGIFGARATTNQACCVMPPSTILHNKFLFYWLFATRQEIINLSSGGGQPNVNQEKIASLRVSAPSFNAQQKIANFLDHETAKIDTLIAKQQELIKLLKEKRQAVISHAVTKGLNPNAPMRDSGVEWLGEVPAHWITTELKRYSHVQGGYAFSSESYSDHGIPIIRIGDIMADGNVSLDSCKRIPHASLGLYAQYLVKRGDLLMAMTGATIGKAGWYCESEQALLNQRVGSFKCNELKLNVKFFWYILNCRGYQEYIRLTAFGGAQPNISDSGMVGYHTVIPTLAEQESIAHFLDCETLKIDLLIEKQETAIKFMFERRTALISAAVTGKIDVRDWQPPASEAQAA